MIYTSYFANHRNFPPGFDVVNIALKPPFWFKGKHYRYLFPTQEILYKYKADLNKEDYIVNYRFDVLDKLNPQTVFNHLDGSILLCYEKRGDFCHRRIVAEWLHGTLNIEVPEL